VAAIVAVTHWCLLAWLVLVAAVECAAGGDEPVYVPELEKVLLRSMVSDVGQRVVRVSEMQESAG